MRLLSASLALPLLLLLLLFTTADGQQQESLEKRFLEPRSIGESPMDRLFPMSMPMNIPMFADELIPPQELMEVADAESLGMDGMVGMDGMDGGFFMPAGFAEQLDAMESIEPRLDALARGFPGHSQELQEMPMPDGMIDGFPLQLMGIGGLQELLGPFFEDDSDGPRQIGMPMVSTMRLRLRPDHGFNVQPLDHQTRDDGGEVIKGDLPKGLDGSTLHVEQRGHVVLIRYSLNRTTEGREVGVEQQVRLGFQPDKKEKANYDAAVGRFEMAFDRPSSADFDPTVEIVFAAPKDAAVVAVPGAQERASKQKSADAVHAAKQESPAAKFQPSLLLEVGDEL